MYPPLARLLLVLVEGQEDDVNAVLNEVAEKTAYSTKAAREWYAPDYNGLASPGPNHVLFFQRLTSHPK